MPHTREVIYRITDTSGRFLGQFVDIRTARKFARNIVKKDNIAVMVFIVDGEYLRYSNKDTAAVNRSK